MYNRANVKTQNVVTATTLWGWLFPLVFVGVCLAIDRSIYTQHDPELESEGYKA